MARCVCNNPCTCYFEYDGDRPNTIYTVPYQYGRYSTRRTGSGTAVDPYVVEFLDSEEFLVEAGQVSITTDITLGSSTSWSDADGFNQLNYETPYEMFIGFIIHGLSGVLYINSHKFWLVSAQATFVNNGLTPGTRKIGVLWHPPAPNYGPGPQLIVAGNSITPVLEDMTISCSGLAPFSNFVQGINEDGPGGYFQVILQQSSGANMTVRGVTLSMVAI